MGQYAFLVSRLIHVSWEEREQLRKSYRNTSKLTGMLKESKPKMMGQKIHFKDGKVRSQCNAELWQIPPSLQGWILCIFLQLYFPTNLRTSPPYWKFEIGHGRRIYTMHIDKHYPSGHFFSESLFQHKTDGKRKGSWISKSHQSKEGLLERSIR